MHSNPSRHSGFFSLENEVAKGNYGLWDQNAALRWVKENIVAFGGDPNRIAIVGESAGAGSASAHVISPHSRGTVHVQCCVQYHSYMYFL